MPRPKGRRRREEPEESLAPVRHTGNHLHTHELHGFDQVAHLRRRYRAALGYVPREP
jgi:hypothetical protein